MDALRELGCEVRVLALDRPVVHAPKLNLARRRIFVDCWLCLDFYCEGGRIERAGISLMKKGKKEITKGILT